jgi:alpha-D-xyloside xylohydrolase
MLLEFRTIRPATRWTASTCSGESLLVAPVFSASAAQYYVPAGRWTKFLTDEVVTGRDG